MSPVLANWGSRVIVGRQEICRKCHLCIPAISYIMCKICDTVKTFWAVACIWVWITKSFIQYNRKYKLQTIFICNSALLSSIFLESNNATIPPVRLQCLSIIT